FLREPLEKLIRRFARIDGRVDLDLKLRTITGVISGHAIGLQELVHDLRERLVLELPAVAELVDVDRAMEQDAAFAFRADLHAMPIGIHVELAFVDEALHRQLAAEDDLDLVFRNDARFREMAHDAARPGRHLGDRELRGARIAWTGRLHEHGFPIDVIDAVDPDRADFERVARHHSSSPPPLSSPFSALRLLAPESPLNLSSKLAGRSAVSVAVSICVDF